MGFAAPLALLGLLAVALPLLAHRVRRRDLPVMQLPTAFLLQRALAAQRRKRSLADLLLLLLRLLLVAGACLAVAAPYVVRRVAFGDGQVGGAAVVIDDSLSMMRTQDGRRLLSVAVERAQRAIAALPAGSEISLVLGGAPARLLLPRTTNLDAALAALEQIPERSHRGGDLQVAARLALQQLAAGPNARRHLLVLSDFARHTDFAPGTLQLSGTRLQVEALGDPETSGNVALSSVTAVPDPTAPQAMSLAVEVRAFGAVPPQVQLQAGEAEPVAVELVDGRGRALLHVPRPPDGTVVPLQLALLLDDALDEDNHHTLLLGQRSNLHVLAVNGDPHPASARDELWFASRALRLSQAGTRPVRVTSIDTVGLRDYDLSNVDVLVLANVPAPPGPVASRIERFVRAGGGLVIAAGDQLDPQRYGARMDALLPAHITAVQQHAATSLRAESQPQSQLALGGLAGTRVQTRLVLDTRLPAALSFSDGLPAIALGGIGRGQVALVALPLDGDWSDLPYRPGYLPLLTSLVRTVAGERGALGVPHAPGETVPLPVPPGATRMEVVAPDGFRYAYGDLTPGGSQPFEHTLIAGSYEILVAGPDGPMHHTEPYLQVALPAAESDLVRAPLASTPTDDAATTPAEAGALVRRDLSPFAFVLAGLFAMAEGLLRPRRRTA